MQNSSPATLREVAQRASDRHDGKKGRGLAALAKQDGLTLSHSTVDKILSGTYFSTPGRKTIEALAALSGVPIADVYAAAGMPLPVGSLADLLPPDADLLTPDQRRVVVEMVRLLAQQQKLVFELTHGREAGDRDGQEEAAPMKQADELAQRRQAAQEDPPAPLEGAARKAPEGGSEYERVTDRDDNLSGDNPDRDDR